MKNYLLTISILLIFQITYSQTSTITVYSQNAENFFLYLNNTLQCDTAKSSITVKNLNLTVYSMKIEFEDIYITAIEKTLYVTPATNSAYTIKKKTNGKYKLWLVSQISTNQGVVNNNTNNNNTYNPNGNSNNSTNVWLDLWSEALSIDLNGMVDPNNYVDNGYNGGSKPTGCTANMSTQSFANAKQTISAKSFEDDKIKVAQQIAGTNCLKSYQVKEIMMLFSFEDSKLKFAKYAYHHTSDLGNYYTINDAFTFSTSIDDLNNYINSLK